MKLPEIFSKKLHAHEKIPLAVWIWRAYCKGVLLPLLCLQVVLVGLYLVTQAVYQRQQQATLQRLTAAEAQQRTQAEAKGMGQQLATIVQAATFLQSQTRQVISQQQLKIDRSARLNPVFRSIQQSNKRIAQVYFSTDNHFNHSYPYREVSMHFSHKLEMSPFAFYNQDDALLNPSHAVVWTDIYQDRAGHGWMSSLLAPVYSAERLEGVVGVDVRLDSLLSEVLGVHGPEPGYAMLVGDDARVIAMPALGERHWAKAAASRLEVVTDKIKLRPVAFNAEANASKLLAQISAHDTGVSRADLAGMHLVSWALIPQTAWKLVITAPEPQRQALSHGSAPRSSFGWWLACILLVLHLVFIIVLYRQARKMSQSLSLPLARINKMLSTITAGKAVPELADFAIAELSQTAQGVVLMGLLLDVASKSRQLAEAELEQRNRQLQSVFDLSPDGLILTDEHGYVVLVNPALCQMTGVIPAEYLFKPDQLLWQKLVLLSTTPDLVLPGEHSSFRLVLATPRKYVLQCNIINMYQQDSAAAVKLIHLRDITRDAAVDQMKSEFITTAAHELRTPLTSVLGYSELLMKDMIPSVMRTEAFEIVVSKTKLVINIINEMLDLARIEARHGMDFNIKPYLADVLVHEVVASYPLLPLRSAIVTTTLADLSVNVDQEKFKAVLINLLDNAYKYSSSGDVQLQIIKATLAERLPNKPSELLGENLGENQGAKLRVGFRVQDQGIGMSAQQSQHAFDRFWRADASGNIPGTGLGLAIVKEVMQVLGGSVDIESSPGAGTAVTLWLPAVDASADVSN